MTEIPQVVRAQLEAWNVSRESLTQLRVYVETLTTWQKRINLIGPATAPEIWTRHILDGAQLLPLLPAKPVVIADLGSGAGIPGLVLAIAGGHDVDSFESNGKKIAFQREVIRRTGCKARCFQLRLETLAAETLPRSVDYVVSRALAPLSRLLDYASPFLERGARAFFHKGQDVDAELTEATKYWKIDYVSHPSLTDSKAVLLEITEARRDRGQF